jgi:ApbE superfamily uncharacterized protein (UPF0280 family)
VTGPHAQEGGIHAALLPDGRRLHLQHGPIDLVIEAFGAPEEIRAAYGQATAGFADVLPTLVNELPLLRKPLPNLSSPPREGISLSARLRGERAKLTGGEGHDAMPRAHGSVAQRMVAACWPHRVAFITPMAAVAGAVADHMLQVMLEGRRLDRAYVNDGGDIAFHLAPGQQLTCGVVADLAAPAIDGTIALTHPMPVRGIATSGRATRGQGGRSFSLGIADSVTVLAHDAAAADAAATMIANAVDLPGHSAVVRGPASEIDPDSDLGRRLVTLAVGRLTDDEITTALRSGTARAEGLRRSGLIHGAVLVLRRCFATVGAGLPRLQAA